MKTTDINKEDESLEDAAEKVYPIKNTTNPFYAGNNGFKLGANWQSEKDKVIIDKLVEALKNVVDQFSKVTPLYSKDELILKESNDLLNSLNIK